MAWSNGFKSKFWVDSSTARTSISSRSGNTSTPGWFRSEVNLSSRPSNSSSTAASYWSRTLLTVPLSSVFNVPSVVAQTRYFRIESAGKRGWNFVRIGYRASVKQQRVCITGIPRPRLFAPKSRPSAVANVQVLHTRLPNSSRQRRASSVMRLAMIAGGPHG
jgi:hypothetical protein